MAMCSPQGLPPVRLLPTGKVAPEDLSTEPEPPSWEDLVDTQRGFTDADFVQPIVEIEVTPGREPWLDSEVDAGWWEEACLNSRSRADPGRDEQKPIREGEEWVTGRAIERAQGPPPGVETDPGSEPGQLEAEDLWRSEDHSEG